MEKSPALLANKNTSVYNVNTIIFILDGSSTTREHDNNNNM